MNWLKDVELDTGVVVGFWVLKSINVNLVDMGARVNYFGFLNEKAFNEGKAQLTDQTIEFNFSEIAKEDAISGILELIKGRTMGAQEKAVKAGVV